MVVASEIKCWSGQVWDQGVIKARLSYGKVNGCKGQGQGQVQGQGQGQGQVQG